MSDTLFVMTIAIAGNRKGRKLMLDRLQTALETACEVAPLPDGCSEVVFYNEERKAIEMPQKVSSHASQ